MLGTERWEVISSNASWIAAPSSTSFVSLPLSGGILQKASRTDLIKVDGVVLGAHFAQESLGGFAVWAVGLAEDG